VVSRFDDPSLLLVVVVTLVGSLPDVVGLLVGPQPVISKERSNVETHNLILLFILFPPIHK
jgi:hypothetical protein